LLSTAATYGNRKAPEKLEGLEFNGNENVEVIALNYSHHRSLCISLASLA
jgi:hypothetical protein